MRHHTLIILAPGFPADDDDTTCLPTQQLLVKALNKNYPSLKIIILAFQYPFKKADYKWFDNRVISFNGRQQGKLKRRILWVKVWLKLKRIKKENSDLIILSFWLDECAFVGNFFAKHNNVNHFIWLLGQDAKKGNKFFKKIKPKPEELIALSDFITIEFFKNYGVKPASTIPAGIDTLMYNDKREKNIDILGVGSLIPLKRFDIFVNIVYELIKKFPELHAVICGKGSEKINLEKQIEKLKLSKNITLTGELPYHEVIALMQRSKILLHPSSYEGFGAVIVEALYAGAHAISFCKALNEDVAHWNIAADEADMKNIAANILINTKQNFSPVLLYTADDMAHSVMSLLQN